MGWTLCKKLCMSNIKSMCWKTTDTRAGDVDGSLHVLLSDDHSCSARLRLLLRVWLFLQPHSWRDEVALLGANGNQCSLGPLHIQEKPNTLHTERYITPWVIYIIIRHQCCGTPLPPWCRVSVMNLCTCCYQTVHAQVSSLVDNLTWIFYTWDLLLYLYDTKTIMVILCILSNMITSKSRIVMIYNSTRCCR